jgi:type I site-specific restriction endonuclease
MIATGTDVKPLEVLIFLRDVKSALYFEQRKGRGARTITSTQLRQVTPDAEESAVCAGRRDRRDREPETCLAVLGPRA